MTAEFEKRLQELADYLADEIRAELTRQGHVATGQLRDSVKVDLLNEAGKYSIAGKASHIAKYVDWGRRPGGKRVPHAALEAWVVVKGLAPSGKKASSLAWAIQYSIWKNGVPTSGDKTKTEFITRTLATNKEKIIGDVKQAGYYAIGLEFDNMVRAIKEKYNVS